MSFSSAVIITGCRGFIGKMLCAALKNKTAVLGIDTRPGRECGIDFLRADLSKEKGVRSIKKWLKEKDYSKVTLVHLAGEPRVKNTGRAAADTNTRILRNALGCLKGLALKRVVFSSSALVYGTKYRAAVSERARPRPENTYARSKLAAERYLYLQARRRGFSAVVLRLTNVYGPEMNSGTVIASLIRQTKKGKAHLREYASERDFLYVKDAVAAFLRVLSQEGMSGTYNVGTGRGCSMQRLMHTVARLMGKKQRDVKADKSGAGHLVVSCHKLKQATGWKPRYSLARGLKETIDSYA